MSKKVNVIAPGIARGNLISLFKQYVTRRVKEERAYWASVGHCLGGRHSIAYLMGLEDSDYDSEMEKLRHYYNGMSDDDYYVDDDGCIVFPPSSCRTSATDYDEDEYFRNLNKLNNKGKYKHRKHRKGGKKARVIDISTPYSGSEDDPLMDESEVGAGKVYFYPNYEDKYDRIEFDSLIEFDKYCQEEGYLVPPYVGEVIAYKPVSHCCLNPYAKEHSVLEIMAEESYADMLFEASDEMSLTER